MEYADEETYLRDMRQMVAKIASHPADFLEAWNLTADVHEEEFGLAVRRLGAEMEAVIRTPYGERGPVGG